MYASGNDPVEGEYNACRIERLILGAKSLKKLERIDKDIEIKIPFDPTISLLGIYPRDYKSLYYKDTRTRMFTEALFTTAKTWNQPKCPSVIDWIKKMWHIDIMEYYAAIKEG